MSAVYAVSISFFIYQQVAYRSGTGSDPRTCKCMT